MKKIKLICLFTLGFSKGVLAQVGIEIASPQKALHISGASTSSVITGTSVNIVTPTIRVNGLSNANQNIVNTKLKPVMVTDKGDLVVSESVATALVMIDPINTSNATTDFLTSPITTDTSVSTETFLKSFTFTLNEPSLVNFNANTSIQLYTGTGAVITDGKSKLYGTKFKLSTAPSGVSTADFGQVMYPYSNTVNITSATGILYVISTEMRYLPAGNYAVDIYSTINTNVSTKIVAGNGSDTLSIIAYPVNNL